MPNQPTDNDDQSDMTVWKKVRHESTNERPDDQKPLVPTEQSELERELQHWIKLEKQTQAVTKETVVERLRFVEELQHELGRSFSSCFYESLPEEFRQDAEQRDNFRTGERELEIFSAEYVTTSSPFALMDLSVRIAKYIVIHLHGSAPNVPEPLTGEYVNCLRGIVRRIDEILDFEARQLKRQLRRKQSVDNPPDSSEGN